MRGVVTAACVTMLLLVPSATASSGLVTDASKNDLGREPAQVGISPEEPTLDGLTLAGWKTRWQQTSRVSHDRRAYALRLARRLRRLHQALRDARATSGSVNEAINLAAVAYKVSAETLHRKAECESHKYARALNSSSGAAGVFQFLGSTWRSTPYARFSVYSPYANSLAAAYMHHVGRGGEWACR